MYDCPLMQQGSGQQSTWLNVPSLAGAPRYKEAPSSLYFLVTLQSCPDLEKPFQTQ